VQRQEGTARVWQTVASLNGSQGSGQLPSLPLGIYSLRIAALGPHNRVLAQRQRQLDVFGNVPLATLLGQAATTGVFTSPTNTFSYVISGEQGNIGSGPTTIFGAPAAQDCRGVHIEFAVDGRDPTNDGNGRVSVVQESADAVGASAPFEGVGTLDARVVPGQSWSVNELAYRGADDPDLIVLFDFNGYASCYSAAPILETGNAVD
jgi:hypothetical protein